MVDFVVRDYLAVKEAKVRVEGLTVVRGESYSGKSSMFRAIEAAMTNRFASGCVRWGSPQCSVSVRFGGDGSVLKVTKTEKGGAVYELASERFEKTGRNVPAEVQKFLGCGYLRAGADMVSLNFWEQFSKPLLWSFSQAKISEMLGNGAALLEWTGVNKNLTGRRSELKGAEGVLLHQVDSCRAELSSWEELAVGGGDLFSEVSVLLAECAVVKEREALMRDLRGLLLEAGQVEVGIGYYRRLFDAATVLLRDMGRAHSLLALQLDVRECSRQEALVSGLQEGLSLYESLDSCVHSPEKDVYASLWGLKASLLYLAWRQQEDEALQADLVLCGLQELYQLVALLGRHWGLLNRFGECIGYYAGFEQLEVLSAYMQDVQDVHRDMEVVGGFLGAHVCPFCGSEIDV